MLRIIRLIGFLAALFLVSASSVKADGILNYTLTLQGSSTPFATWQMPLHPTPSCPGAPCSSPNFYTAVNVEIFLNGGPATSDTLIFFNANAAPPPVDFNDVNFLIPEFFGEQLYTGNESAPTMKTGSFLLTNDGTTLGTAGTMFTLDVTPTPEPASLLLVGTGLLAASFGLRKRRIQPGSRPS